MFIYSPACVSSFTGHSGFTFQNPQWRARVTELVQRKYEGRLGLLEEIELGLLIAQVSLNSRNAGDELQSADVTFGMRAFYNVDPGGVL